MGEITGALVGKHKTKLENINISGYMPRVGAVPNTELTPAGISHSEATVGTVAIMGWNGKKPVQ